MSAHGRHLVRTLAIALAVSAAALLLAVTGASAYVTGHGTGSSRASVTTLAAPTITRTSAGAASVTLTWSTVAAPASGSVTYYVSRDNGTASAACPASGSPTSVTSCTDTGVSTGAHTYTVTALWRSWTRTSAGAAATVAYGPATQLVYTTQPGGSPTGPTGGVAFPTQPVVTARDASGNTVADYSGSVTLAIVSGTGTSGAALSGCTGTLANGVTTFSGCAIDKSGANYRLRASDRTLTVDSSAFTVSVGATARLAFTTQPGGGATGGSAFPTQPVVTAQDAGGNTVTTSSSPVTLSIVSGTGTSGAALTNCSGSRSNGVTTFSNCEIDKAGTGYQLHASAASGTLTGDSSAFAVSVGSVSQIVLTTQPGGGATGGVAFPTQPVVTAQDAGGNTVTSYSRAITLSIVKHTGDSNATLSGCTSSLRSGVTTFAGCEIDLPGADYQLTASDGTRSDTSVAFAVTVGPAAQLVFTTSPGSSTAGSAFGTQPVVTAQDAGGNTVTTYAGTVTLSVGSGPAGTLSGCSGSRRNGVTTFSGCKLDRSGTYTLHASDGSIAGDSASFTVSPGSVSTLAFTTQPAGAVAGSAFTTQPVITALDAFGNVATSYNSTVSMSIKAGTGGGGTLTCTSVRASSGVAAFSGCRISRSGTAYQLRATDGTRTVDSAGFDVR